MVSLGNQVTFQSIEALPLHAGPCRGWPNTSLATRGIKMEMNKLNKSFCEEIFRAELDMTEEPEVPKFQVRQYTDSLWEMAAKESKMIQRITQILEEMEDFGRSKKNTFLPIREGITEVKEELDRLRCSNASHKNN